MRERFSSAAAARSSSAASFWSFVARIRFSVAIARSACASLSSSTAGGTMVGAVREWSIEAAMPYSTTAPGFP
jgi:hypothetical protein